MKTMSLLAIFTVDARTCAFIHGVINNNTFVRFPLSMYYTTGKEVLNDKSKNHDTVDNLLIRTTVLRGTILIMLDLLHTYMLAGR